MAKFEHSLGFDIKSEGALVDPWKYKETGFVAGHKLSAPHFNWIINKTSKAIDELQKKKFDLGGVYSDDMNELVSSGQYRLHNNTNLPPNSYYGQAFVGRGAIGADTVVQIVVSYSGHKMYYRGGRCQNDKWIWEEWSEIYSTNNNPYAQNLNGVLPIPKGGTGATDRKTAFSNLAFLGTAPISAVTDDTPEKWTDVGTGYAWYNPADKIIDKPSDYAILINLVHGADLTQFWIVQPLGRMYKRSGSVQSGWSGTWFKAYDEKNKPTPAEIGAVASETVLPDEADLNKVTTSGAYRLEKKPVNTPEGVYCEHAQLQVVHGGNDTIAQMLFPHETSTMYLRTGNPLVTGGKWNAWVKMADSEHTHTPDDIDGIMPIAKGGTGADNVADARENLGFCSGSYPASGQNSYYTIPLAPECSNLIFIWNGSHGVKGFLTPEGGFSIGNKHSVTLTGDTGYTEAFSNDSDTRAYYANGRIHLYTDARGVNRSGTYYYVCL